jgi:hypothetical protein
MLDLLKWRAHPERINDSLLKLKEIDGSEIVKVPPPPGASHLHPDWFRITSLKQCPVQIDLFVICLKMSANLQNRNVF